MKLTTAVLDGNIIRFQNQKLKHRMPIDELEPFITIVLILGNGYFMGGTHLSFNDELFYVDERKITIEEYNSNCLKLNSMLKLMSEEELLKKLK